MEGGRREETANENERDEGGETYRDGRVGFGHKC